MKPRRTHPNTGAIIGALLMCSPLLAWVGMRLAMKHAFRALDSAGITDPQALSNDIRLVLFAAPIGMVLFALGAVLLIVSLVRAGRPRESAPPPPSLA